MDELNAQPELLLLLQTEVRKSLIFRRQRLEQETPSIARGGIDERVRALLDECDIAPFGGEISRYYESRGGQGIYD